MADSYTANLNLTKPEVGASRDTWGTKTNADWDAVDALFAAAGTGTSVGLNVGAGKTLAVAGTLTLTGTMPLVTGGSAVSSTLTLKSTSGVGTSDSIALKVGNNGATTAMTINTSGQVGIGTTTPDTLLNIQGADPTLLIQDSDESGDGFIKFQTANGTQRAFIQAAMTGNVMLLGTGTTERMRIDANGNVMTGATSATFASSTFKLSVTEGTTYTPFGINSNAAGVGATNAAIFARNGTQTGAIGVTGTTTSYGTSSDYRLKENVQPMTGALAKVALLKPYTYQWKADGSDGEGFIAHELAEVCHHAVFGEKDATNDEGEILAQSVDASFLIATLTAAIQEQQAMITALANRITALEV